MKSPNRYSQDALNIGRGFLMGAADIVPGVSGGTVALILGIYHRLVTALSHVDRELLALLRAKQWGQAAGRLDLRFLVALGAGIGIGIVGLAHTMHELLTHHREPTYSAFFGLILASGVLVGRMCRPADRATAVVSGVLAPLAAFGAYLLVSQTAFGTQPGLLFTFFSGCVGICAMILPGVSGSYILLLMGKYEEITGIIKNLPKLQVSGQELLTLVVFAGGCVVGLLLFSKALRWLLVRHGPQTMAILCGFMIGSLWKVWPFQRLPQGVAAEGMSLRQQSALLQQYMPETFNAHTATCLAIAVGCFAGVLLIDAAARRSSGSTLE